MAAEAAAFGGSAGGSGDSGSASGLGGEFKPGAQSRPSNAAMDVARTLVD